MLWLVLNENEGMKYDKTVQPEAVYSLHFIYLHPVALLL